MVRGCAFLRTVCSFAALLLLLGLPQRTLAANADKVRLTASDSPDPVSIPGQSSRLSCVAYVRKVAGLGGQDDEDDDDCDEDQNGRRQHGKTFSVVIQWSIRSSSGAVVRSIEKTVAVQPPLTIVKLPLSGSNKKKKFAQVPVELTWDGRRSDGTSVSAGTYSYTALALFTRSHAHGHQTVKIIDESDPVSGSVTVHAAGVAPTLSLSSPSQGAIVQGATVVVAGTVSGTSPISVSVNGTAAALTNNAFSVSRPLTEGLNTIQVVATNAHGTASATRQVTRDSVPPAITISSPATGTSTSDTTPEFLVSYADSGGTGVDSASLSVILDSSTITAHFQIGATAATFTPSAPLAPGNHLVVASVRDRAGWQSTAQSSFSIVVRPAPPSIAAYPATTNVPEIVFSGTKPTETALLLDGVERVPVSVATTWLTTKTLIEGPNRLVFSTRTSAGLESDPVTVTVTLDSIPPAPPVVASLPGYTTTTTVTLTGTKPAGTGIIVNGVQKVPVSASTTWSTIVTLSEGSNHLRVESVDAAGNRSLAAGSQLAGVAAQKPVIRDLVVTPAEFIAGQSAQLTYRLFASDSPPSQADLRVSVRVESGDLIIKELFAGVQAGSPSGPSFTATWDGTDASGAPVPVNVSYRLVVSATSAVPTTAPPELSDANPKETAVVLTGSQHVTSGDGRLEIVFRPDDAKLTITPFPPLSPRASRLLTSRSLHPRACYRVEIDRAFSGPAVGVLKCSDAEGSLVRPFCWDELQQDWRAVALSNWNPAARQLSFRLPGPGLVVFATTSDTEPPYVRDARLTGTLFSASVCDDGSGIDPGRLKLRRDGNDVTSSMAVQVLNGVHELQIRLDGVDSLQSLVLYAEDRTGHGRLLPLGERRAP